MSLEPEPVNHTSEHLDNCPPQWKDMQFQERQSATWQNFAICHNDSMQEPARVDMDFDSALHAHSTPAQVEPNYRLEPSNILAQDCILSPTSFKLDTEMPWMDSAMAMWPGAYKSSMDCSPVSPLSGPQDKVLGMRKERRRAQNRKAQQAFRERKDKAIQRLEKEVEKLSSINHSLTVDNESRLREIKALKAELEARSSTAGSPIPSSYFEGWEDAPQTRNSISSETSMSPAASPVTPDIEAAGPAVSWIKWRGRVYVDNGGLAPGPTKGCG